jgi:hypothetical protein
MITVMSIILPRGRGPCFLIRILLLCFLLTPGLVHPQEWVPPEDSPDSAAEAEEPEAVPLPRSFHNIFLGIGLDTLKGYLRDDAAFNFREERDVSLLPSSPDQTLVETQGSSFIRRAFFQLSSGEVFIMSFTLNTALVDHYSVFTTFVQRYGEPTSLNPQEAVWEDEDTRISIERPLTVKYIDKNIFTALARNASPGGGRELLRRNEFLDGF